MGVQGLRVMWADLFKVEYTDDLELFLGFVFKLELKLKRPSFRI